MLELLEDIYSLKPSLPVKAGDRLITDWKGSGIDVVAVRSLPDHRLF
jgi:CxxC motif-containing protein